MSKKARRAEVARKRETRHNAIRLFMWALVAILAVIAILILRSNPARKTVLREHPVYTPLARPVRPRVPPLPPVKDDSRSLQRRVEHILQHHADLDVRKRIDEASSQRNLMFVLRPISSSFAALGIVPRTRASIGNDELDTRPFVAVMYLDIEIVKGLDDESDMLGFMALIGHEYQHYVKWTHAPQDQWIEYQPKTPGVQLTPDQCQRQFEDEVAAFTYECRILNRWGVSAPGSLRSICHIVDRPEFPRRLLWYLRGTRQSRHSPECFQQWTSVARSLVLSILARGWRSHIFPDAPNWNATMIVRYQALRIFARQGPSLAALCFSQTFILEIAVMAWAVFLFLKERRNINTWQTN